MTELLLLIAFAASQIGTPGPANMALMTVGARFGLRAAMPFVAGVALGKQMIIWPLGFGLAGLAISYPAIFAGMKWLAAAYICWLAYRVAGLSLKPGEASETPPGFMAGLWVHPLNPKAWAMIIASFTSFTDPGMATLTATALVATVLLGCQIVLHPLWTFAGEQIARALSGTIYEVYLMRTLALITVASVALVLI